MSARHLHQIKITRREALRLGTGTILGGATAFAGTGISQNAAQSSRVRDYAWVRGFNYQPSWGSHGITIWGNFQETVFAREVDQGLRHFPKLNVLRIWFSYDAHMVDSKKFLAAAKRTSELLAERKIKMIPVFFNFWHSIVDFGGLSMEQLRNSRGNHRFGAHRQYLHELIEVLRPADGLLMYDLVNEPFNNGGKEKDSVVVQFLEAMAGEVRRLDPKTPVTISTPGCPGVGGTVDLDLIDSFVDVHAVHPYWIPGIPAEKHAENFAKMVEHLEKLGKPAICTECCWGSNDDAERVKFIRHELRLLKAAGIGFLPHALCHSPVADLHRPVPGRDWETMYMGFIEPDGLVRAGHGVYNEFAV